MQLTREQQYQIYALMRARHAQTMIASIIGCPKSTASHELRRNHRQRGYRPKQAHEQSAARHSAAYRPRKTLGFRAPNEVFFKQPSVALQT